MRYKAIFKDQTHYALFGAEYFGDKAVFWRSHQTNLVAFSIAICEKGRPLKIVDSINEEEIIFECDADFDDWYVKNQSHDLDFGFSNLTEESAVIIEARTRMNQVLDLLKDELSNLQNNTFDPWRIDGGYKELEKQLKLGLCSMEKAELRDTSFTKSFDFKKLKQAFKIPFEIKLDNLDIITFSKQAHDKLDSSKLIDFCNLNIKQIIKLY